jgi:hypothetical protein
MNHADVYRQACFRLDSPPQDLPDAFGIVTACNPRGVPADGATNRRLDAELGARLTEAGIAHFRIIGGSRDGSHAEPGYGCLVDRTRAVQLGRERNQEAVFWVEGGELFLIPCAGLGDPELLGSFRERVIGV